MARGEGDALWQAPSRWWVAPRRVGALTRSARDGAAAAALSWAVSRYFCDPTGGDSVADEVGEGCGGVGPGRGRAMAVARELSRIELPDTLIGRPAHRRLRWNVQ